MDLFELLKERNLIYQTTDENALKNMLKNQKITVYSGVDPTADSLHIGHCVPYTILRRFQQAGHRVIILIGGATGAVGDPSGKTELRSMLTKEAIDANIEKIKENAKLFLNFDGENPAIIVNNAEWFKNYSYIDFMREIGVHFNVNKMLTNEIYAKRLENGGLTFFEMGYMLMQAYDFVYLNKLYDCTLQIGGADQWGNIVAGVELGRKLNFVNNENRTFVAMTNPLLLTPEGKKMGKTEKGAIWISKDKISAFDFYQGIYQTPDSCVRLMFSMFTDIPMSEVDDLIKTDIVEAKKRLSYEITKFIRGENDANLAKKMSENLFENTVINKDNAPKLYFDNCNQNEVNILDILVSTGFISSKGEGRRLITQGGLSLDDKILNDPNITISNEELKNGIFVKKGKKNFAMILKK